MSQPDPIKVLDDRRVEAVVRRLYAEARRQLPALLRHYLPKLPGVLLGRRVDFTSEQIHGFYADKFLPLDPEQAAFAYLTARALRARTVVEFGTSFGLSTLWLAAAVRDNGGGRVVSAELLPQKAERAREHVAEAGLTSFVEIRTGDAMTTLRDIEEPVDLLLNDGFPMLARPVLEMLAPRLREGGVVLTDNVGSFPANYADYVAYVRDPRSGFRSTLLPYKSGTEYSVRLRHEAAAPGV